MKNPPPQLFFQQITYKVSYIIATTFIGSIVFLIYLINPGINGYYKAMFGDMIYGEAYRPFVYRLLLPNIVRFLTQITPPSIRNSITGINLRIFNWEPELLTEYLIASILMCASLIGFCLAVRYLFQGVFYAPQTVADVVSLIALLGLPPFFKYYSYIYDFPTLLLFTLGLGLMVRRKWRAFLFIFLLACLNKETTILLTLVFTIYFLGRWEIITQKQFIQLFGLQVLIFLLIRTGITWGFSNNPGVSAEFHLIDHNFGLLTHPYTLSDFSVALWLVTLIFYRWTEKPVFLKNSIFILIPLLGATLFFGFIDELRDYYEVYPVIFLLISHTIGNILGIKIDSLPTTDRIFKPLETENLNKVQ